MYNCSFVMMYSATSSALSETDRMYLVTEPISIVLSIASLVLVILGFTIIRDVRTRSFDALFSFLAQLKARLSLLEASLGKKPENTGEIRNVFYYLHNNNNPREWETNGSKVNMDVFINHAKELIELLASAKGQIPVTERMADNLDALLEDLVKYSAYPNNEKLAEAEIIEKYGFFINRITEINTDIAVSRHKQMKRTWRKTERAVAKHEKKRKKN